MKKHAGKRVGKLRRSGKRPFLYSRKAREREKLRRRKGDSVFTVGKLDTGRRTAESVSKTKVAARTPRIKQIALSRGRYYS
jgi:hypothetical protein